MKTYIYKITPRKNDVNGNPRSLVTVYRIKKNKPLFLGENTVGFRSNEQAVCDIIKRAESLKLPIYHYLHGRDTGTRLFKV